MRQGRENFRTLTRQSAGSVSGDGILPAMRHKNLVFGLFLVFGLAGLAVGRARVALAASPRQAATETQPANRVEIFADVNVRAGPCTCYDQVGVLLPGQTSAIIGRNPEGTWFEIEYVGGSNGVGWVFKDLVHMVGDLNTMPTVVPPPTPTLPPTTTPGPGDTQSSLFISSATPNANRLPTFTAPAAIAIPTLLPAQGVSTGGAFPPAVLIIVLLVLGTLGVLLSLLRLRQ
jgi:hypothetical protein